MRRANTGRKSSRPSTASTLNSAATDPGPDLPFEEGIHNNLDPDLRHRMISEAAYYLYTRRNFGEGHDLDDWLTAEQQVDHTLLNPSTRPGNSVERD